MTFLLRTQRRALYKIKTLHSLCALLLCALCGYSFKRFSIFFNALSTALPFPRIVSSIFIQLKSQEAGAQNQHLIPAPEEVSLTLFLIVSSCRVLPASSNIHNF